MKKIISWCKSKAAKAAAKVAAVMSVAATALAGSALAAEGETATIDTGAIASSFTSGFNNIVTTSIDLLSAMLPIALTLCAVLFLVKKGMAWFKSIAK